MTRYILIAGFLVVGAWAHAQTAQHQHGVNVPDWYDPSCCNNRDCFPVENVADIEAMRLGDAPVFKYRPTGNFFGRDKFKKSQDERYHVCIGVGGQSYCIYLPTMI